ncbi:replication initiation and membrane attachment family protein [Thermaerobacillus caldiproteolyticus]|uniref:Replication initiation and membrane attachment protein n=1 Tax=Thermaerobacillus caldiproteolyticus TaxID=247480 RepID=A0A7W0BWS1_9BACL|nr:replication initiation and membrane attachment family protein [Anoxybacillus caldiproteolyticus]MBA2873771.1 replication initiation and membrane attachment protein [Anoxybacillus caldiproteolyticus]QPA30331.1 replication initiation and membrane attachment family protein [Anoxybacillus caldiproteolyticus]
MEHHWKELIPVDRYTVRSNGILHDFDRKVITLLYQPLIGHRAFSLYMTLWSELEQQLWGEETTHHSLMAIMQCSLKDIYDERLKLEGIGLLKTYVNHEQDPKQFIYELQPPLTPEQFFTDGVLNVFLYNRIGKTKFHKLKQFFSTPSIDRTKFSPVTRSFNDIFYSVHPEQMVAVMNDETKNDLRVSDGYEYIGRSEEHYTLDDEIFDFELFFAGLSTHIVPKRAITTKVREAIKKLAFLYGIGPLDMQKLVMNVIDPSWHIDIDALRKAARDWYQFERGESLPSLSARVQPLPYRTMTDVEPKTKEEQLIKQLETISPRQLLIDISGGAEPSMSDLQLIEDIMFQQKLLPGVVNVLIYYVMLRTDMKLSKAYVEKIASHWARKKIRTVKEAMELAKREAKKYQSWANEKEKKTSKKVVRKEMLPDWLNMDYSQNGSETTEEQAVDVEEKRRELEERLKKYRNE